MDLIRLTGDYLGRSKHGGQRETVLWKTRFFADSDATTTIRWYGVPADRPVLPVTRFMANEAWHDWNGPFSGMQYGQASPWQGSDWSGPVYRKKDPRDDYNPASYCGTPEQWAGQLSVTNPADLGTLGCCSPLPAPGGTAFGPITPAATIVFGQSYSGSAALIVTPNGTETFGYHYSGIATLTLTAAGMEIPGYHYSGIAVLTVTPRGTEYPGYPYSGSAALIVTPNGTEHPGYHYSGIVSFSSLTATGTPHPGYRYSGVVALTLTAAGTERPGYSYSGKASVNLTPAGSFVFTPAVAPGGTCAAAGVLSLGVVYGPFTKSSSPQWFTWPLVSGTTYFVKVVTSGSPVGSWIISEGTCASLTQKFTYTASPAGSHCNTFAAAASDNGFAQSGAVIGIYTYTIEVGTGACPP